MKKKAKHCLVSLDSLLMDSGKKELEVLIQVDYLETYLISDETKIINKRGMIFSQGKQVNTYLIQEDCEITDFSKLPRENED